MATRICPIAAANPQAIAFDACTYDEFDAMVQSFIKGLVQKHCKEGDVIAIVAKQESSCIALLFGAWALSLTVFLVSHHLPESKRKEWCHQLGCKLVIEDADPLGEETSYQRRARELKLDHVSLLLLTSGSSGSPKLAAFSLRALFDSAERVVERLEAKPQARWSCALPFSHVAGLGTMVRALISEGELLFEKEQLETADFVSLVPTQLYRLLKEGKKIAAQVLLGASPIPKALYEEARARGMALWVSYGLTEASSTLFLAKHPVWVGSNLFLGEPLPGRELCIKEGELLVRSPSLFLGYGVPPVAALKEGFFATGDLALYDSRYGYAIVGRKDRLFISGGENIQPEEIEKTLLEHPLIERVCVVAVECEEFGERPFIFIQGGIDSKSVKEWLRTKLSRYQMPVGYSAFPEEVSGLKSSYRSLAEHAKTLALISQKADT